MDAIISGRAGVALLLDGASWLSFDVDDPDTLLPRRQADARLLFGEVADLVRFENVDHARAAQELERAFNSASALDLTLILLDSELPEDIRADAADELENLLSDPRVNESLENVLYGRPLPAAADIKWALEHCDPQRMPKLSATLQLLEAYQPAIREVCEGWDELPASLFKTPEHKQEFQHVAVREGVFRELAVELSGRARIGQLLIKFLLNPAITSLWNCREVFQQWTKEFQQHKATPDVRHESDDDAERESRTSKIQRRQRKNVNREEVLEKVQSQKALIIHEMRQRDLERARKIVDELIDYQLKNGEPIHAVKSLCDLAIEAKLLGIYPIQIELTERAIKIMPDDGWSWAQYADALLRGGRLPNALKAYEQAQVFGEGAIAKRGRGEVLKALGRLDEALDTFDEALGEYPEDLFAKTGRAETLRALGRLPEALSAYDAVIAAHSESVVAKSGRAETLRALGRLPEALSAYDAVIAAHSEDVIAKTGRAETLRALGRPEDALSAYDEAIAAHPESVVAKTGRAETLRALGRLPEALSAYDETIAEHPGDVVAKRGRAEVVKALGRLSEALVAYDTILADNPNDDIARSGRSSILATLRRYDEALRDLPDRSPLTQSDWIGYHIRGMILLRKGDIKEAIRIFEEGVRDNPWPSDREYFRTALAVAYLRRGDFAKASQITNEVTAPLLQPQVNVLRLHSFGAQGDYEQAATASRSLADNKPWSVSDELISELHRRYVLKEEPLHDDDWVFEQEIGSLLLVGNQQTMPFA